MPAELVNGLLVFLYLLFLAVLCASSILNVFAARRFAAHASHVVLRRLNLVGAAQRYDSLLDGSENDRTKGITMGQRTKMNEDDARRLHAEYWQHARHVENQLHSFVNFYTVIIAGTLAFGAVSDQNERLIGMGLFIAALSILGLFFNYNLRRPFLRFVLMSELIAIVEFDLCPEYRRFFDKDGKVERDAPHSRVDTYDIFAVFFIIVAFVSFSFVASLLLADKWKLVATVLVILIGLIGFYRWTKTRLNAIVEEIQKRLNCLEQSGQYTHD